MKKNKVTFLNIISNIILQLLTIISGFIIPKLILKNFGSSVNGLVSSINQFLSYITLIEGGVSGVVTASMYKPLYEKDNKKLSSVVNTTSKFYRTIGYIYIIYSLLVAILYPLIFNTDYSFMFIFSLALILSLNLLFQYMFSITFKSLLNADKKVYIVSFVQCAIVILNIILAYISIIVYPSIHVLKLLNGLLFLIQPIIYNVYVKKNYELDKNEKVDDELLKNRWNGFAINVAAFIHFSTDVSILTIFTDLSTVSVYSVYALVTNGLRAFINSVLSAIKHTVGQAYAKGDMKELNEKMDICEYIVFILVFFCFTIAGLLITPFVMIYTKNITDTNYYQPLFGILIVISEALYLIKIPHLNLSYVANKFKELTVPAFIEAGTNIGISLILVKQLGIMGVAIGTICGMIYRMVFQVHYTKKIIPDRDEKIFYLKLFIFILATLIGILFCNTFVSHVNYDINDWILHGIVYSIIFASLYTIVSICFCKKEVIYLKKYLIKK